MNNNFRSLLKQKLDMEITWRIDEITLLKTIPFHRTLSTEKREILQKYSIPAFYALWEGFVIKSFEIYLSVINRMNLNFDQIHPYLIAHDLDMKFGLKDKRANLNTRVDFSKNIKNYFNENLNIKQSVPTKSNASFKVVNNILISLNLPTLEKGSYCYGLTKLLKFRNFIAHGDNSLRVSDSIVFELSKVVIDSMDGLYDILLEGIDKELYKSTN